MAEWPDGIDMEALLAPIAGDSPTGVDLREDFSPQSPYFRLRDARAEARAAERAAESAKPGEESPMPQQWRDVRTLAISALSGKSKDLEIAAWLTESLVRTDGLRGLAAGAHLIAGLLEFWDSNLFPMPDEEDGMLTRVAPVAGLNGEGGGGTLSQPLSKIMLFQKPDGLPLAMYQYEQSEILAQETNADRIAKRVAAGVLPFKDLEAAAKAAGAAHFVAQRKLAKAALAEWRAMGDALDTKAGSDSPSTSAVRGQLEKFFDVFNKFAPPEVEEVAEVAEEAVADAANGEAGSGPVIVRAAPVITREDMLRDLTRIAEYFRRTEPQSPLSYTLDEAIRRGRLSWPDLLAEVVGDANVRGNILTQLGIRPVTE